MVFKSLKKSKTRRQYTSLSAPATQSYNIADFYPNGYNFQYAAQTQQDEKIDESKFSHRRYKSFNHVDYAGGRYLPEDSVKPSKQLVRFRSHRRMFSCITGS